MNIFSRTLTSIRRNLWKNLLIFFVLLVLGSMVSISILIGQAIQVTEDNLRRSIPPIATILQDDAAFHEYYDAHGREATDFWITAADIEKIGNLPYVRAFDYAVLTSFISHELKLPSDITLYSETYLTEELAYAHLRASRFSSMFFNFEGVEVEFLPLKGIRYAPVLDIQEGLLELVDGRVFTEYEVENAIPVAIISQGIALENHLRVGDSFTLEIVISDVFLMDSPVSDHIDQAFIHEMLDFEVIGIFKPTVVMDINASYIDYRNHMSLNDRIYVPIEFAMLPERLFNAYWEEVDPTNMIVSNSEAAFVHTLFALYDPLDLDSFYEAASELVPHFWRIDDLRHSFGAMSTSMAVLQNIANGMIVGVIIAAALILGLLITLLLRERRFEMGIYLALGESKLKIVFQMLLEMKLVSLFALAASLFIGNLISKELSATILQNEIVNHFQPVSGFTGFDMYAMGFGVEMTIEEMMAAYSVNLDSNVILLFIVTSFGVIFISTIFPTLYLISLKPKAILTESAV